MKRFLRLIAPAVLALCNLLLLVSVDARGSGDGWYTSLREAEAVAAREGKPILADFSTTWCPSCRNLERNTFPNPRVQARMDNFVKVRVDGEDRPDLVRSYGISGYPTLIAMSAGGKELNRTVGYVDASELSSDLDRAMRKHGAQAPKREPVTKAAPAQPAESAKSVDAKPKQSKPVESRQVAMVSAAPTGPKGGYAGDEDSAVASREPNREINYYTLSEETRAQSATVRDRALASASARPIITKAITEAVDNSDRQARSESVSLQRDTLVRIAESEAGQRSLAEAAPTKAAAETGSEGQTATADTTKQATDEEAAKADKAAESGKASSKELPRPMLNVSGRDADYSQSGPSSTSKAAPKAKPAAKATPADTDEAPSKAKSEAPAEPDSAGPTAAPAASGSILGTIHKLADQTPQPGETSGEKAAKSEEKSAKAEEKPLKLEPKAAKSDEAAPAARKASASKNAAEDKEAEPKQASKSDKAVSKKTDEPAPARKATTDDVKAKSSERASRVPASDEVSEWIRAAEAHQAAKRWKNARADYARVVDRDPKNINGQTDLAYIRMCALMVSPDEADNDKARMDAYEKIREFKARFPNSPHMDYYTVTRADLAADLGRDEEARNLLADFTKVFPKSRYTSWARESWERLEKAPASAKRKTSGSQTASKSKN